MTAMNLPPQYRKLLYGLLIFIPVYFLVRLLTSGTLEVGIPDWGTDMGYTQLLWGLFLVVFLVFLLYYMKQTHFRLAELDRAHVLFTSSTIFFLIAIVFFGGQFVAHDPTINAYNVPDLGLFDKLGHFITSAFVAVILLKIQPTRLMLLVAFLFGITYELFELVWIWELGQDAGMSFSTEINDVIPDVTVNILGVACGYYYAVKRMGLRLVK